MSHALSNVKYVSNARIVLSRIHANIDLFVCALFCVLFIYLLVFKKYLLIWLSQILVVARNLLVAAYGI